MRDSLDESFLCSVFPGNGSLKLPDFLAQDVFYHGAVGDVARFLNFESWFFMPILAYFGCKQTTMRPKWALFLQQSTIKRVVKLIYINFTH